MSKKLRFYIPFGAFLIGCIFLFWPSQPRIDNFGDAKTILEERIYYDHPTTIYCGAAYDEEKNISAPQGFFCDRFRSRCQKMEWEHAVPAEHFGHYFAEWREGHPDCIRNGKPYKGRHCAEKTNDRYRQIERDMYNLFPAIGAVNATRANKRYGAIPGEDYPFGSCMVKISSGYFEPPDSAKGEVARASLYMDATYPEFNLSDSQKKLFQAWDKKFPPTEWECLRATRIEKIQGNANEFIKIKCPKNQ